MNYYLKKNKISPEYTMISLFIMLFFISFIQSFRLLALTSIFIIVFTIVVYENKSFIKLTKPVLPFVILMLLPILLKFIINGTVENLDFTMMIICKILLSSIVLGGVVSKHSPLYLIEGILNIGFPQIFNKILVLTFRYFHMINEDVKKGRQALTSRGINERKGFSSLNIFGEWIGGFFLKSSVHSEMVFNAMKSRGFEGQSRNKEVKDKELIFKSFILITVLILILIVDGKV
ncbi:MAG: hypothetical protein GX214_02970 [Clostridiales bacterium]|nr:hypothetical protein [Clostridiales bacterium]